MEILEFLIGDEQLPVYRTVTPSEAQLLRALLGAEFHFELEEGEPLDELLFDVLAAVAMRADFYSVPPAEASVLGTFELRDGIASAPIKRRAPASPPRGRSH
jgi:hypothetical protein